MINLAPKLRRTGRKTAQTLTAFVAIIGMTSLAPPPAVSHPELPGPLAAKPAPAPAKPAEAAPAQPYVIKRAMTINEPLVHGFWKWDDAGVPDGRLLITVDTVAQTISVFRDGIEIGVAVILYGADEKPTPTGVFPITQKKVHHISNLYGAPMPYMQRLTNDGVAIHASDVKLGYATHGCVGVPIGFARKLFEATKLGDVVVVTAGERLAVDGAVTAG